MCFSCDSWSETVANPSLPQVSSSAEDSVDPATALHPLFTSALSPSPPGLLGPVLRNAAVRVYLHSWLFTSNLAQLCRPHQQLCAQPCYYLDYTPPAHSSGLHLNEREEKRERERERERDGVERLWSASTNAFTLFLPISLREAYVRPTNSVGACGILSPRGSASRWERHEWRLSAGMLLMPVPVSSLCESAMLPRLYSCLWFTFLLDVSLQLALRSHEYQWGLVFLVCVCGIVHAQFFTVCLSLCVYVCVFIQCIQG